MRGSRIPGCRFAPACCFTRAKTTPARARASSSNRRVPPAIQPARFPARCRKCPRSGGALAACRSIPDNRRKRWFPLALFPFVATVAARSAVPARRSQLLSPASSLVVPFPVRRRNHDELVQKAMARDIAHGVTAPPALAVGFMTKTVAPLMSTLKNHQNHWCPILPWQDGQPASHVINSACRARRIAPSRAWRDFQIAHGQNGYRCHPAGACVGQLFQQVSSSGSAHAHHGGNVTSPLDRCHDHANRHRLRQRQPCSPTGGGRHRLGGDTLFIDCFGAPCLSASARRADITQLASTKSVFDGAEVSVAPRSSKFPGVGFH